MRSSKAGGTGLKPGDEWTIPLCSVDVPRGIEGHHREQHRLGERAFGAKYGIDMVEICRVLWVQSPCYREWEWPHEKYPRL